MEETRIPHKQLEVYAKYLTDNPEMLEEVITRVQKRLFDKFITASDIERKELGSIVNAMDLFRAELNDILVEAIPTIND